jgi:hypothetical protein
MNLNSSQESVSGFGAERRHSGTYGFNVAAASPTGDESYGFGRGYIEEGARTRHAALSLKLWGTPSVLWQCDQRPL